MKSILKYDPETGWFIWLKARGRVAAGHPAGTPNGNGYVRIIIDGSKYYAHRLAWLYMTGAMPKEQIDHINLLRSDNRFANLREANNGQNVSNRLGRTECGLKGVQKHGAGWRAQIWKNGKNSHIGPFDTKEDAHAAFSTVHVELHGAYSRS